MTPPTKADLAMADEVMHLCNAPTQMYLSNEKQVLIANIIAATRASAYQAAARMAANKYCHWSYSECRAAFEAFARDLRARGRKK